VLGAVHDCNHQPFLAEQAFQATATAAGPDSIRVDWKIADGCYLYRNRIKVKAAGPTQIGALALPEGENTTMNTSARSRSITMTERHAAGHRSAAAESSRSPSM